MRLYLIRHGQSAGGEHRCIGHHDLPLSERGVAQMHALADAWHADPPTRLLSSDLGRAEEGARFLDDRWGLLVEVDPRLRELHFGTWEGRTWEEIEREDRAALDRWMQSWVTECPPGGESFSQLIERVAAWWESLQGTLRGNDRVAVIAHAGSIRALLCHLLGVPPERAFMFRLDVGRVTAVAPGPMAQAELLFANAATVEPE